MPWCETSAPDSRAFVQTDSEVKLFMKYLSGAAGDFHNAVDM